MLRYLTLLVLWLVGSDAGLHERHGSTTANAPTQSDGIPWPLPQTMHCSAANYTLNPAHFVFSTASTCDVVSEAVKRYRKIIFLDGIADDGEDGVLFGRLTISVQNGCERWPYFGMDESYSLDVGENGTGSLNATSVWGVLRGLETFSQLVIYRDNLLPNGTAERPSVLLRSCSIRDWPRFDHRGILLDTSRHYLPVASIVQTLELMAQNKFNVFHWHIVDDNAFPFESRVFSELSAKGAYSARHVYRPSDISRVLDYARLRGIRVLAEFDTPGHTKSWGKGLLSKCYKHGKPTGDFRLLDPTKDETFDFLLALFTEILQRFPDKYIHLGGDEVKGYFPCWTENPRIRAYMQLFGFTTAKQLENYYFKKLLWVIERARANTGYIVWQEVLDNNVTVRQDTIGHVWKGDANVWPKEMHNVTEKGYRALLSSCWYLNYIHYGSDWEAAYNCDPQHFNGTAAQKRLVLGGEAAMWGEFVDATNLTPRLWPRASAVAERLWSDPTATADWKAAAPRIDALRCLLIRHE